MKEETRQQSPAKKDYTAPMLVEYGPVAKLTQGGAATLGDAGNMMACL